MLRKRDHPEQDVGGTRYEEKPLGPFGFLLGSQHVLHVATRVRDTGYPHRTHVEALCGEAKLHGIPESDRANLPHTIVCWRCTREHERTAGGPVPKAFG